MIGVRATSAVVKDIGAGKSNRRPNGVVKLASPQTPRKRDRVQHIAATKPSARGRIGEVGRLALLTAYQKIQEIHD
jgi:hypothetical protein